jgi:hypothetical protein
MGFELSGIIKDVLYNKDGTVDYVFDDAKLDEVIAPFENETDTERDQNKTLFLSSSKPPLANCANEGTASIIATIAVKIFFIIVFFKSVCRSKTFAK